MYNLSVIANVSLNDRHGFGGTGGTGFFGILGFHGLGMVSFNGLGMDYPPNWNLKIKQTYIIYQVTAIYKQVACQKHAMPKIRLCIGS